VEAGLLKYHYGCNKLMRQATLNSLEMMTRLMVVEAKDTLARINTRFHALYREEEKKVEGMRAAIAEERSKA
jgi:hypothetical protein